MIDKRVIERQIRKGKLDAAAHRRTLEALPDVSDRISRESAEASRSQDGGGEPRPAEPESEPRTPDAGSPPDASASY